MKKTFEEVAKETMDKLRPKFTEMINEGQVKNYSQLNLLKARWVKFRQEPIITEFQSGLVEEEPVFDLNSV